MTLIVDSNQLSGPGANDERPSVTNFETVYQDKQKRAKRDWLIGCLIFLAFFVFSAWLGDFFKVSQITLQDGSRAWRWVLPAGLPRLGEYLSQALPSLHWETLGADIANWFWRWKIWLGLLLETVLIAFMATSMGVIGGLLISFPAARNLTPNGTVLWFSRRYMEIARTVPDLVWALIFVFCLGVGPMAGVLAIAMHATGALGKLYSEVNENIDMRPLEGIKASGGTWFDQIRYGAIPQILPNIASYTLLRFEINVRSSSIIGYVGAGGLGQELRTAMSFQEYTDLSALFLIILGTVIIIDYGSEKLRHRFIGIQSRRQANAHKS